MLRARLFIFSQGVSTPCAIFGIRESDLDVACLYDGPPGTAVTLFLEHFGTLTGTVLGRELEILRIRCTIGDSRTMRLLQDLTHFISANGNIRTTAQRTDFAPFPAGGEFVRPDGDCVEFKLSEISAHGICVDAPVQPAVGEFLNFGIFFARVTGWREGGFKAQFLNNI